MSTVAESIATREETLAELDFKPVDGKARYTNRDFELRLDGQWGTLVLRKKIRRHDALLEEWLGRPGLWRPVADGQGVYPCFDLYLGVETDLDPEGLDDEPDDSLTLQLRWAMQTAEGKVPDQWMAPDRPEAALFLPEPMLTVQRGSFVSQGELICESARLALTFPILTRLSENLPKARMDWLCGLLHDAHITWRMVRVGFAGKEPMKISAEVDLSGAPALLIPSLLTRGLSAIRCVSQWLATPVLFTADPKTPCRILETISYRETH
jgi:hypothetical protein